MILPSFVIFAFFRGHSRFWLRLCLPGLSAHFCGYCRFGCGLLLSVPSRQFRVFVAAPLRQVSAVGPSSRTICLRVFIFAPCAFCAEPRPGHPLAVLAVTNPATPKKSFVDLQQLTKIQPAIFRLPPPLFPTPLSLTKFVSTSARTASRQTLFRHLLRVYMESRIFSPQLGPA